MALSFYVSEIDIIQSFRHFPAFNPTKKGVGRRDS